LILDFVEPVAEIVDFLAGIVVSVAASSDYRAMVVIVVDFED